MPDILWFNEVTESDADQVGGKGFELARMLVTGLPVPAGFVVTAEAYRRYAREINWPEFEYRLHQAFEQLGTGPVAVRSSALGEDGTDFSFAGQMHTELDVDGPDLYVSVRRCWESLHTDRAKAYRQQQNLSVNTAMAVVVQSLVPADVAGVAFTHDPNDASGEQMAVEASWGLGEVVVSGQVTPDRYAVRFTDGAVLDRRVGSKHIRTRGSGYEDVPTELQSQLCLNDTQLAELADLGRKVEAFYGSPRDIEWAILDGNFYLLQARPITTATVAEREGVRAEMIVGLAGKGDCWVKDNLSEVLPEPTPLTWEIMQRLLAQDGGFGMMNRDFGAQPDESLGSQSAYDLVAGRPMLNLSRLPRMQFRKPPLDYPVGEYKSDPRKALDPQPVLKPWKNGILGLPGTILRMMKMASVPRKLIDTFAEKFTKEIAPAFAAEAKAAWKQDWSKLDDIAVHGMLDAWIEKTLVQFARDSLKPTVLAKLAWDTLVQLLTPKLGAEKAKTTVAELSQGAAPPDEANLALGIREFSEGKIDETTFLERFGHRCRNEMELAAPRWSEDLEAVLKLKGEATERIAKTRRDSASIPPPDVLAALEASASPPRGEAKSLAGHRAHATPSQTPPLPAGERSPRFAAGEGIGVKPSIPLDTTQQKWLKHLRTYIGLREAGKHYLLMGYAVIRRALVEIDNRAHHNGSIFFLDRLKASLVQVGLNWSQQIAVNKKRRAIELALEVPTVLFGDDLDAIGRPVPPPVGATTFQGIPLSAGVAEAAALVLTEPVEPPDEPYILVCPSTDPAWVPLFAQAKALVMETGGVLSHGAIVAREFGLPAVAGLPGIVKQLKSGQRLKVDGGSGTVTIIP